MTGPAGLVACQDVPLAYRDIDPFMKITIMLGLYSHTHSIFKLAMKEFTV
jgi:diadenosine tetraphosphate (Ap4A) HIT family hydrolase